MARCSPRGSAARQWGDAGHLFLERAGLWLQVPLALTLFALGGASWVAWGVLVRLALTQDGFWCVHYVSHVKGEQPYELPGCAEQGRATRGAARSSPRPTSSPVSASSCTA